MEQICIPIRARSLREAERQVLLAKRKLAERKVRKAPLMRVYFEIWLDAFLPEDMEHPFQALVKLCGVPVIAVCRGRVPHGSFVGSETVSGERLLEAIRGGAKFVDVGVQTSPKLIREVKKQCKARGAKLILSKHFWTSTPEISLLVATAQKARAQGADIVKIAAFTRRWSDNAVLFELTVRLHEKKIPCIVVGMGEKGKISRIGCPLLGSVLTYVALDEASRTAPGQLVLRDF